LVTYVFGFIGVLIRPTFRDQKVKVQGHNRQLPEKLGEYKIFVTPSHLAIVLSE